MKEKVIVVQANGDLLTVYSDDIPLGEIGKSEMNRASNVIFNEDDQLWYMISPEGERIGKGYRKRSDCIEAEIAYLNNILAAP